MVIVRECEERLGVRTGGETHLFLCSISESILRKVITLKRLQLQPGAASLLSFLRRDFTPEEDV